MNFFTLTKLCRTLVLSAVLVVGVLCLSGCGGGGKELGENDNPHRVLASFELAYLSELAMNGKVVNKNDLIFEAPTNSKYFIYKISEDVKSCTAKAKVNMRGAKFKKGDYFVTTYNENDFVHNSNNDAIRNVFPEFFSR